jgi:hypothetical protein
MLCRSLFARPLLRCGLSPPIVGEPAAQRYHYWNYLYLLSDKRTCSSKIVRLLYSTLHYYCTLYCIVLVFVLSLHYEIGKHG